MKSFTRILATIGVAGALLTKTLIAGEATTAPQKAVVEQEARKWWAASLSTGWDSLYMFRGVNVLRFDEDGNKQKYGSSLYWIQVSVSFMPTPNDTITLSWMAFGLGNTKYKEFDGTINYGSRLRGSGGARLHLYYYLASVLYQE
jgi:hypothetical protein